MVTRQQLRHLRDIAEKEKANMESPKLVAGGTLGEDMVKFLYGWSPSEVLRVLDYIDTLEGRLERADRAIDFYDDCLRKVAETVKIGLGEERL